MHARKLKHFEERFEWYKDAIETEPEKCKGLWSSTHFPHAKEVHLDLGCGKGQFAVESAKNNPETLFIGLDCEPLCIALAAQKAVESELPNVIFVHAWADELENIFSEDELDKIYLCFNAPFPQKKYSSKRLSNVERLSTYKKLLKANGSLFLKTDSQPYFDYSLDQLALANYNVKWTDRTYDSLAHNEPVTEYEKRLIAKGASIHALLALPPLNEIPCEASENISLCDYLPENLESIIYAPYGMEDTIRNFINRKRNEEERKKRAQQ